MTSCDARVNSEQGKRTQNLYPINFIDLWRTFGVNQMTFFGGQVRYKVIISSTLDNGWRDVTRGDVPRKPEAFIQCWFNVWPASATLAQH